MFWTRPHITLPDFELLFDVDPTPSFFDKETAMTLNIRAEIVYRDASELFADGTDFATAVEDSFLGDYTDLGTSSFPFSALYS